MSSSLRQHALQGQRLYMSDRPRSASFSDESTTPTQPKPRLYVQTPSRQSSLGSPVLPARSQSDFAISPTRPRVESSKTSLSALRSNGPTATPLPSNLTASPSSNSISGAASGSRYGARTVALAMDRFESRTDNRMEARAGDSGAVGAVGFGGTDEWQTVAVRTLPLFNGEGVKGYIEDLNDLVSAHTRRIAERSPANAILYLSQHLGELLSIGMLTLRDKLQGLQGHKLLARLNDLWSFFFSSILPYVEAIFLPFATDARLLRATAAHQTQSDGPSTKPIEVRRLSLMAFRDAIVLPLADQLEPLFASVAQPRAALSRRTSATLDGMTASASQDFPSSRSDVDESSEGTARRLQMVALLTSVMTDDGKQDAMQALNRALRGLAPAFVRRPSTSTFRTGSRAGMVFDDEDEDVFARGMQRFRSQGGVAYESEPG